MQFRILLDYTFRLMIIEVNSVQHTPWKLDISLPSKCTPAKGQVVMVKFCPLRLLKIIPAGLYLNCVALKRSIWCLKRLNRSEFHDGITCSGSALSDYLRKFVRLFVTKRVFVSNHYPNQLRHNHGIMKICQYLSFTRMTPKRSTWFSIRKTLGVLQSSNISST